MPCEEAALSRLVGTPVQVIPMGLENQELGKAAFLRGLEQAEGSYSCFLQEGDEIDDGLLQHCLQRLKDTGLSMAMPRLWPQFELKNRSEHFLLDQTEDLEIDTERAPLVFPTELHGLMIRTEALREAAQQSVQETEWQKEILWHLLKEHPVFCFAGSVTLHYRMPREQDFYNHICCLDRRWYYEAFQEGMLPLLQREGGSDGKEPLLLQCMALHMICVRICANTDNRNKHVIEESEQAAYLDLLGDVLAYVDPEVILQTKSAMLELSPKLRLFLIRIRKKTYGWYPEVSCQKDDIEILCDGVHFASLADLPVNIQLMNYEHGRLEIDGDFNDYLSDAQAKVCVDLDGEKAEVVYNHRYSLSKCLGVSYCRRKTFHVSVPVPENQKNRSLKFFLCIDGQEYRMPEAFPRQTSRMGKVLNAQYWRFGQYMAVWTEKGIQILPYRIGTALKKELHLWKQMWKKEKGRFRKQLPLRIANFLLHPYFVHRKIWLFWDKIYKGGDSSEYLYKYALPQKDGIHKYYLLDTSCPDYKRMRKEGYRPLKRGSLRHHLIFLNADILVASNSTVYAFNGFEGRLSEPFRGVFHADTACVQHGMSVQKIAVAQQRLRDNTRLYFCASKYEIANLSKPEYDYEGYDALKLTGVPRYDGLKDRKEKVLLFSPTWRMNSVLPAYHSESYARDYNPNFKETDYYKVYNGLLNDPRLLEAARRYGYKIRYVLHPIISPQYEDFTQNPQVEIISSTGEMSYEQLFCESALMVTDYSGVQFDFAYMRKPVVYLHHKDIPQHYEEGTFHYKTMGFGEICTTNEELIDVLCRYMEHDCEMPDTYRRRADDFFYYSDHHNCERIYKEMLAYQKKKDAR